MGQGRKILVDKWNRGTGKGGQGTGMGSGKRGFGKGDFGKGFKGFFPMIGYGKGFGRPTKCYGEPDQLVYVGNLKYEVKWQDLKDHMKQAGNVEYCEVLTEDGTDWGRSRGAGCVRY